MPEFDHTTQEALEAKAAESLGLFDITYATGLDFQGDPRLDHAHVIVMPTPESEVLGTQALVPEGEDPLTVPDIVLTISNHSGNPVHPSLPTQATAMLSIEDARQVQEALETAIEGAEERLRQEAAG